MTDYGDAVLLVVRGVVEKDALAEFEDACTRSLAHGRPRIVLDLRPCTALDPAGAHLVAALNERAQAAGQRLVIHTAGDVVRGAFRETGLAGELDVVDGR